MKEKLFYTCIVKVFVCGSMDGGSQPSENMKRDATLLGKILGENGHTLLQGGCEKGLGEHGLEVIVINTDGFFDGLKQQITTCMEFGFSNPNTIRFEIIDDISQFIIKEPICSHQQSFA